MAHWKQGPSATSGDAARLRDQCSLPDHSRARRNSCALMATITVLADMSTAPIAGESTNPLGASVPATIGAFGAYTLARRLGSGAVRESTSPTASAPTAGEQRIRPAQDRVRLGPEPPGRRQRSALTYGVSGVVSHDRCATAASCHDFIRVPWRSVYERHVSFPAGSRALRDGARLRGFGTFPLRRGHQPSRAGLQRLRHRPGARSERKRCRG